MEAMFRCGSCGQQWAVEYPEGLHSTSPRPLQDVRDGPPQPKKGPVQCSVCGKDVTQVVTIRGRSGGLILDNRPKQSRPGLGKGGLDSLGGGAPGVPQLVLATSYSAEKSWAGSWPVDRR